MRYFVKAFPLAVLVLLGLALFFRKDTDEEIRAEQAVAPPTVSSAPAVEIQHTLVTADVINAPVREPRRIPASLATARQPEPRTDVSSSRSRARAEPSGLAARTRRVILGDGRHKPQPFPRANNN